MQNCTLFNLSTTILIFVKCGLIVNRIRYKTLDTIHEDRILELNAQIEEDEGMEDQDYMEDGEGMEDQDCMEDGECMKAFCTTKKTKTDCLRLKSKSRVIQKTPKKENTSSNALIIQQNRELVKALLCEASRGENQWKPCEVKASNVKVKTGKGLQWFVRRIRKLFRS